MLAGDLLLYSKASVRTPDGEERDWEIESFVAVDRRLAERLQQWRQENGGTVFANSEGQMLPSYLIGCVPNTRGTIPETLEIHALEVCVYAAIGVKLKYSPGEKLITNVDPPGNKSVLKPLPSGRSFKPPCSSSD